jgi:hypothetical protein
MVYTFFYTYDKKIISVCLVDIRLIIFLINYIKKTYINNIVSTRDV